MLEMPDEEKIIIDAKTFQEPLAKLAETIVEKVKREGPAILRAPFFVAEDLCMMIRQSLAAYRLLFYLNADQRRAEDCYWNNSYGVVSAPIVRSMIDCLYNVTFILEDPAENGMAYRKSGFRRALEDISEDKERYGGQPEWDAYNKNRRDVLLRYIRATGLPISPVLLTNSNCATSNGLSQRHSAISPSIPRPSVRAAYMRFRPL
jgi:hypothetical protein